VKFAATKVLNRPLSTLAHDLGSDAHIPVTEEDFAAGGTLTASGREGWVGMKMTWRLVPEGDRTDATIDIDIKLPWILRAVEICIPTSLLNRIPNMAEELLNELERGGGMGLGQSQSPDPVGAALAAGFDLSADGSYFLRSKRGLGLNGIKMSPIGLRVAGWTKPRLIPWATVKLVMVTRSHRVIQIDLDGKRRVRIPRVAVPGVWPYRCTAEKLKGALDAWHRTYSDAAAHHRPTKYFVRWATLDGKVLFDGAVEE
jgi:hypothetical protein